MATVKTIKTFEEALEGFLVEFFIPPVLAETEFEDSVLVSLTQYEVDMLHILLGHVCGREALNLEQKISPYVSKEVLEKYDLLSYTLTSEDGLSIKIE